MKRIVVNLLVGAMLVAFSVSAWAAEPTLQDLFRARALVVPPVEQELGREVLDRTWDFSQPDRGNFTYFSEGVKDLAATSEGALRFGTDAKIVTLGWGNYDGKQALTERVNLWRVATVELRVKQSAEKSTWRFRTWCNGNRSSQSLEATLNGKDWQVLKFDYHVDVVPNGFELEIGGEKGNVIEIASLRLMHHLHEGYFRKEFELPRGQVWQALAEVGTGSYLYINGKEVSIENPTFRRPLLSGPPATTTYRDYRGIPTQTMPVDLKPYLKPGKNCIGLYGRQSGATPFIYLQGQAIASSGEVVRLDSDETWRFSHKAPRAWSRPGFDDRDWQTAETKEWTGNALTLPVYDGRLVLENPYQQQLFYDSEKPVVVRVRVPAGLADRQPKLTWRLTYAELLGEKETAQGEVPKFTRARDSLVYEINLGELQRGVHAVEVALRSGEEIIEERYREPLMVVGKIPMPEVAGDTYEEGMKLTLEDTIDFTDPNDPHPWVEGLRSGRVAPWPTVKEPRIVRKNGMVYRETRPGSPGAGFFSYQFEFKHPGDLYLMVLEYPNDAERWIGVSCEYCGIPSQTGMGIWTGDKYPITNTMQELRWIFASEPRPHQIDIVNLQAGSRAAARRLRIYRIEELPALKVNSGATGQRWLGAYTERTNLFNGFGRTYRYVRQMWKREPLAKWIEIIRDSWDVCEQYTRYLRFSGQNLHVMGCYQYYETNTGFTSPAALPTSRIPVDIRDMAIRIFGKNGIDVVASIEYTSHTCLREEYPFNNSQIAAGADTALVVSKEGVQGSGRGDQRGYAAGWNFLHPRVQELMLSMTEDLAQKFKDQPNFKGINWTIYLMGEWHPGFGGWTPIRDMSEAAPLLRSYDDATIACFQKDTGLRVPGNAKDPQRFEKRYQFLTSEAMKEKWIAWRCQKVRQFFLKARDRMRAQRRDLDFFFTSYIDVPHDKAWAEQGRPLREFVREWGHDPSLYRNDKDLWITRWMHATLHQWPAYRRPGYAVGWEQNVGSEFIDLHARDQNRAAMIMHLWFEIVYPATFDQPSDKHPRTIIGRIAPQPNHENAREPFTQALIGSDPQAVWFALVDATLLVGHEQQLREFARVFLALPKENFQPVDNTGFQTNLVLRELRKGGDYYFYVANPGYWPVRGSITLAGAERVVDLAANRVVNTKREGGKTIVPVQLKPYGVAAYRVEGAAKVVSFKTEHGVLTHRADDSQAKIVSWQTEPLTDKDLAHMRDIVSQAEAILGNPRAKEFLSPEDSTFLEKTVASAQADLAAGQYARAWSTLTNWRFWNLLREKRFEICKPPAWYVIGPFGDPKFTDVKNARMNQPVTSDFNGLENAYITETGKPDLDKKHQVYPDKLAAWQKVEAGEFLSFDESCPQFPWWMVAYAYTEVYSPSDRAALLFLGSDHAIKVWINDQVVFTYGGPGAPRGGQRPSAQREDEVQIRLQKGWNRVLVKVVQRRGLRLYFELTAADGEPMYDLQFRVPEV